MYFEHVQKSSFTRVVETEEEKFGMFIKKAERCKDIPEPPKQIQYVDIIEQACNLRSGILLYNEHLLYVDYDVAQQRSYVE